MSYFNSSEVECCCGYVPKERTTNIERHQLICQKLHDLYCRKNHDYGDSFHETFLEEGLAMPRIRLSDKLNRFKALTKNIVLNHRDNESLKPVAAMVDENLTDTLMDLANYAIMTIMELDRQSNYDISKGGPKDE